MVEYNVFVVELKGRPLYRGTTIEKLKSKKLAEFNYVAVAFVF
jgi:hypothetical protein